MNKNALSILTNTLLTIAILSGGWFFVKHQYFTHKIDPFSSEVPNGSNASVEAIVIGASDENVSLLPLRPEPAFFRIEESAVERLVNTKIYPEVEAIPESQKGKDRLFTPIDKTNYRF